MNPQLSCAGSDRDVIIKLRTAVTGATEVGLDGS